MSKDKTTPSTEGGETPQYCSDLDLYIPTFSEFITKLRPSQLNSVNEVDVGDSTNHVPSALEIELRDIVGGVVQALEPIHRLDPSLPFEQIFLIDVGEERNIDENGVEETITLYCGKFSTSYTLSVLGLTAEAVANLYAKAYRQ
jgi:hypothetical protein